EVHERSLETDLLIGLIQEVRIIREDLVFILMSATLDTDQFAEVLVGVPIVRSTGLQYPVEVVYHPWAESRINEWGVSRQFLQHVAQTVDEAIRSGDSDALVFLPGRTEISTVARTLSGMHPEREVLPL